MRPLILFVHPTAAADLLEDQALLASAFDVRAYHFDSNRYRTALGRLWGLVRFGVGQLLWLLRWLPKAKAVYGCFADYHLVLPTFMARRFGVPVAVRLGGFDGNTLPEYGYGVFNSRWRGPLAAYVLRRATRLFPVTPSLIYHESRFATWPTARSNGVQAHVQGLSTPFTVIPTGYDPQAWPQGKAQRADHVTTVGYVGDRRSTLIKGIDLLLAAAAQMLEVTFSIVGVTPSMQDVLAKDHAVGKNVTFYASMPRSDLAAHYTSASVYAQLSRTEGGLPNVVAEAMLCGCMPVVSAVGSMAETVGTVGLVVDRPEVDAVVAVLREALASARGHRREEARAHITAHYPLSRRAEALTKAMHALIAGV